MKVNHWDHREATMHGKCKRSKSTVLGYQRASGSDRGCVKTSGDYRDRAKGGDKVDCGSILCKFVHQESSESESENFVLCFYTTSAGSCPTAFTVLGHHPDRRGAVRASVLWGAAGCAWVGLASVRCPVFGPPCWRASASTTLTQCCLQLRNMYTAYHERTGYAKYQGHWVKHVP